MARTIQEIASEMEDEVRASPALAALNSSSRLAVWRQLLYVFAGCAWALEKLFDELLTAIKTALSTMKPHTTRWYQGKTLLYQHGRQLAAEQDFYFNPGMTEADIALERVVKYAAVVETPRGLLVKVAGVSGNDLAPLPAAKLGGLVTYLNRVKDAGVRIYVKSSQADTLRMSLKVYYDPLLLDGTGARLDGTDPHPVPARIRRFLKEEIPFNGLLVVARLVDALQEVEGVVIPHVVSASARYGLLNFQPIEATYQPDAGWLRIADADLAIQYIPHEPI